VHIKDSKKDLSIGSKDAKERHEEKQASVHKHHILMDPSVHTCQRQHGRDITEKNA
jgi:hypothetical protein